MAGVSDHVRDNDREASHGLTRGRCHWARAVAELTFIALSEAKGRSRGAENFRCAGNDWYLLVLCNRPGSQVVPQ